MSFRDISAHIKDMYDTDISATTISSITDKVIPLVKEWQARPLEALYCMVWLGTKLGQEISGGAQPLAAQLEKLTTYFKYPSDIRRLIYTTNTIEGITARL